MGLGVRGGVYRIQTNTNMPYIPYPVTAKEMTKLCQTGRVFSLRAISPVKTSVKYHIYIYIQNVGAVH